MSYLEAQHYKTIRLKLLMAKFLFIALVALSPSFYIMVWWGGRVFPVG